MGYAELFETRSTLYRQAKSGKMRARDILEMLITTTDLFTGKTIDEDFIAKSLGVKKNDVITKEHVARLKKSQLRKIAVAMQGIFTSNSYDYEHYKISANDIAKLIAVLVKRDGALKKDAFVEWYASKLYGTKLYGDALFSKLAGSSAQEEISKDDIVKNFVDAVNKYSGDDDSIEEYDPNSKHDEKDDRGDAYIFVKKDLQGMEPDKGVMDALTGLVLGKGDGQEDGDEEGEEDNPEGEEDSPEGEEDTVEEMVEYTDEDPELGNEDEEEPRKKVNKDGEEAGRKEGARKEQKDEL